MDGVCIVKVYAIFSRKLNVTTQEVGLRQKGMLKQ